MILKSFEIFFEFVFRLLVFQVKDEEIIWKSCKEAFIKKFEESFAKTFFDSFERKKADVSMETYVKDRLETWSKIFPCLSKADLNMIVMAGISEDAIKKLKLHKSSDLETMIALCEAVSSKPAQPTTSTST